MKGFTLLQALIIIQRKLNVELSHIEYEDGSRYNFNVNDTGRTNSQLSFVRLKDEDKRFLLEREA
jgi:hypothetical protein